MFGFQYAVYRTIPNTKNSVRVYLIGFFNGPGWSQSGGPWIKTDQSMRYIVSNEKHLKGPMHFSGSLEYPDSLFHDIALLAFPVPKGRISTPVHVPEKVSSVPNLHATGKMFDQNNSTHFIFPDDLSGGNELLVDLQFENTVDIQHIRFDFLPIPFRVDVKIQAVNDDREINTIREFTLDRRNINFEIGPMRFKPATFSLPGSTSKRYRIIFSNLIRNGDAGLKEIQRG